MALTLLLFLGAFAKERLKPADGRKASSVGLIAVVLEDSI
jgi:hypothetical protein